MIPSSSSSSLRLKNEIDLGSSPSTTPQTINVQSSTVGWDPLLKVSQLDCDTWIQMVNLPIRLHVEECLFGTSIFLVGDCPIKIEWSCFKVVIILYLMINENKLYAYEIKVGYKLIVDTICKSIYVVCFHWLLDKYH
jgi:hypothetical protein